VVPPVAVKVALEPLQTVVAEAVIPVGALEGEAAVMVMAAAAVLLLQGVLSTMRTQ